jgi:hypothetical protein
LLVARIDALWGEGQREIRPRDEPGGFLEQRQHDFIGRARVGGGLDINPA